MEWDCGHIFHAGASYLTQMPRGPAGYSNWLIGYVNSSGFLETVGDGGSTMGGPLGANAYISAAYIYFPNITDSSALQICSEMNRLSTGSPSNPTLAGGFLSGTVTMSDVFGTYRSRCIIDTDFNYLMFAVRLS